MGCRIHLCGDAKTAFVCFSTQHYGLPISSLVVTFPRMVSVAFSVRVRSTCSSSLSCAMDKDKGKGKGKRKDGRIDVRTRSRSWSESHRGSDSDPPPGSEQWLLDRQDTQETEPSRRRPGRPTHLNLETDSDVEDQLAAFARGLANPKAIATREPQDSRGSRIMSIPNQMSANVFFTKGGIYVFLPKVIIYIYIYIDSMHLIGSRSLCGSLFITFAIHSKECNPIQSHATLVNHI